jgi:hypothetical protein
MLQHRVSKMLGSAVASSTVYAEDVFDPLSSIVVNRTGFMYLIPACGPCTLDRRHLSSIVNLTQDPNNANALAATSNTPDEAVNAGG